MGIKADIDVDPLNGSRMLKASFISLVSSSRNGKIVIFTKDSMLKLSRNPKLSQPPVAINAILKNFCNHPK